MKKLLYLVAVSVLYFLPTPHLRAEVNGFGVTPTVGAVGDGRLTTQVSLEGTLICLRWPNATFYEHVNYKTGFWNENQAENALLKPHYGAAENAGVFAGVRFTYGSGATTTVLWLREAEVSFKYAAERSNRLVATYQFANGPAAGLEIEEQTFNVPGKAFLTRTYTLRKIPAGLTNVGLISFANPALRNEHGAYAPNGDYEQDSEPRFASFALPEAQAILTALPKPKPPLSAIEALVGKPAKEIEAYIDANAPKWNDGIYLAQGGSIAFDGFQVGTDFKLDAAGPEDAFLDADDGTLQGNGVVTRFETTAMHFPLTLDETVAWYAAFGTTATGALANLTEAKSETPDSWAVQSDKWWEAKLENAILPSDPKGAEFSLRALISMLTAQDPESGAIVASTSCQPPYNVDWPRDGAFFQYVLNMNGLTEEADKHARFYPKIQYTQPGDGLIKSLHGIDLVGRFPMNAFADYIPGGPIDFEIDNTGFALWAYLIHASFLGNDDPAEARRFLEDVRESIRLAADLLTICKDETNNLQCYANEDDNPEFTQSFHGAITTWLGLTSAVTMFEAIGENVDALKYRVRAMELEEAIRENYDPSHGAEVHPQQLAWSYWPGRFWSAYDTDTNNFASTGMMEHTQKVLLDETTRGTQYSQKSLIALQLPPLRDATTVPFSATANEKYVNALARQDTLHLAEFTNYYDFDQDGHKEWFNQVATPHAWAQVLVYLSLIAQEKPELLELPELKVAPAPTPEESAGCSCSTGGAGRVADLLPVAIVLALLWWRRRNAS